jgi:hypothetical protein
VTTPRPDATAARDLSALDLALNLVASFARRAEWGERDPLGAYLARNGEVATASADVAARLAIVSIARDFHDLTSAICHVAERYGRA